MKNKKQKNIQPQKQETAKLVQDRNFPLGLGVIIILIALLGLGLTRYAQNANQNKTDVKSPLVEQIDTVEDDDTIITPTLIVTDLSEQENASASSAKDIKELPNTQGGTYHTVSANENFWKISKKVCGSGIYYLSIKQYNGYEHRTLRPGDVITVFCSQ